MTQAAFPFIHARAPERVPVQADAAELQAQAQARARSRPQSLSVDPQTADPGDALGFDHARYGLVPPAQCLWPGHPVREGWERGRGLLGRRTRPATLAVRRWLALRLAAWQQGEPFDDHQITIQLLRSLEVATHCPVSGRVLDEEAQVVPADGARGWVAGNLVLVSAQIAGLWRTLGWEPARTAWEEAQADPHPDPQAGAGSGGLSARQWGRLAVLKSLATPLPHAEAAALPLRVLPPNRLRLVNPIQELQAVLTLQLAVPGWGQRTAAVTQALPLALRCEFPLFFHSLLAQALRRGLGPSRAQMREALEGAWEDPVVLRRWRRFARGVDATLAQTLVDRLAREGLPGVRVVRHGVEPAAA